MRTYVPAALRTGIVCMRVRPARVGARAAMDLAAAAPRQRVQQILARYGGGGNLWARTRLRLLDAFRIFDKDGDGAVSMQEMIHGLRSLGLGFSEEDIAALAAAVDADSDGTIDYTEFVSYFKPARGNNSVAPSCNDSTASATTL